MDYTNTDFWIAIGVGGSIIAAASAGQQFYFAEKGNAFRTKPVVRDFCLGAFLTAILYMFLPESMHSWISAGSSAVEQISKSVSDAAQITESVRKGSGGGDIELQFGPARF
jgi:hypothetical protein